MTIIAAAALLLAGLPGGLDRVETDFPLPAMTLFLSQSASQHAALERLLDDQQNPASPEYHRWLTPEQYADRFGLGAGDIARITAWLRAHGFTVAKTARSRTWIVFSGTARQAEDAFRTEIHRLRVEGELHFSNTVKPTIPPVLEDVVMGMDGLDDFAPESGQRRPEMTAGNGTHTLAPDDWATIYNVTPLYQVGIDGTGQKIVVAGNADFTAPSLADVATFRSTFNLPPNVPQVVRDPNYPDSGFEDSGEGHLDVEWAGAVARNATIIYVHSNTFFHAVQYAIDNNLAPVITVSANSGCETQTTLNTAFYRMLAQQGNAQGITWLNSGTDSGPAGCDGNGAPIAVSGLGVRFPSSIPEVTAVGGTEFNEQTGSYWNAANNANGASAISYIPEMVWNDSVNDHALWAGGGGASVLFSKPAWQIAPGVPNDGARDMPDVALAATFNHDGYYVYRTGGVVTTGGTSASAPTFAGVVVLLNQYLKTAGVGNINPGLYRLARTAPGVFHDVTVGSNIVACMTGTPNCTNGSLGFTAGPGYDQASGLGSVDAAQLVMQWNSQPQLSVGAAVNGASFSAGGPAAPGSIISIFGTNLSSATGAAASVPLPNVLVDATVTVAGTAAPLFYASAGQINAQLPFETPAGNQTIYVTTSGVRSGSITLPVAASVPGIFLYSVGSAGNYAVAQHANYQLIGPTSPARGGETVILYATGQGAALTVPVATGAAAPASPTAQVAPSVAVSATIAGKNAPVSYAGLTAGLVGLLQVNLQVPNGLAPGDYPLVVTIGGAASNAAMITVNGQ